MFLLKLETGAFDFLSTELENIVSMNWERGNSLQFARIEGSEPTLYRYDFASKQRIRMGENPYADITTVDGTTVVMDANLDVWLVFDDESPRLLTQLASESPNRWKLTNDALYHSAREENLAFLLRTDLKTGATEKMLLGKNRYRIDFDLSADTMTLLSVRSVLAQSDLIRLEY